MPEVQLSALLRKFPVLGKRGTGDPTIKGLSYDSRRVSPGDIFFALDGLHTDGNLYIDGAVKAGALTVVTENSPMKSPKNVVVVQVPNVRQAMSTISARFYNRPSRTLPVIGVTGTDGKTSTVYYIDQLLQRLEEESGFLSTALVKTDVRTETNPYRQSTPEASEIQAALYQMIENGKRFAVVEATSHGLSEKTCRLKDVDFRVAVFTSLSPEHLDFHDTVEQYRSDKANLFRSLDRGVHRTLSEEVPVFGVVNAADSHAYYFKSATRKPVFTYSINDTDADLRASSLKNEGNGTSCKVHWRNESRRVFVPHPGSFSVENVLAAVLTVAKLLHKNPIDILDFVSELKPVPGRMEVVSTDTPFTPIVDYAHTPGAFEKLLPEIKERTKNRLIVLFGSAGERDLEKRPLLGALAARYADIIVLADEDPRGEQPLSILEQIAAGCFRERPDLVDGENLLIIPDRIEAIKKALSIAREGDTLLFLGKGHEKSIVYADHVQSWYEFDEVYKALQETQ